MQETLNRLLKITDGCREDMHEPDEQLLSADVFGHHLDNAFPPTQPGHEFRVKLTREGPNASDTEYFNLATLIALARKAQLDAGDITAELLDTLKYVKLNLTPLVEGARATGNETCISQDLRKGGTDILEKIDEAISQAEEEN